jgi:hypothetical protein
MLTRTLLTNDPAAAHVDEDVVAGLGALQKGVIPRHEVVGDDHGVSFAAPDPPGVPLVQGDPGLAVREKYVGRFHRNSLLTSSNS